MKISREKTEGAVLTLALPLPGSEPQFPICRWEKPLMLTTQLTLFKGPLQEVAQSAKDCRHPQLSPSLGPADLQSGFCRNCWGGRDHK